MSIVFKGLTAHFPLINSILIKINFQGKGRKSGFFKISLGGGRRSLPPPFNSPRTAEPHTLNERLRCELTRFAIYRLPVIPLSMSIYHKKVRAHRVSRRPLLPSGVRLPIRRCFATCRTFIGKHHSANIGSEHRRSGIRSQEIFSWTFYLSQ